MKNLKLLSALLSMKLLLASDSSINQKILCTCRLNDVMVGQQTAVSPAEQSPNPNDFFVRSMACQANVEETPNEEEVDRKKDQHCEISKMCFKDMPEDIQIDLRRNSDDAINLLWTNTNSEELFLHYTFKMNDGGLTTVCDMNTALNDITGKKDNFLAASKYFVALQCIQAFKPLFKLLAIYQDHELNAQCFLQQAFKFSRFSIFNKKMRGNTLQEIIEQTNIFFTIDNNVCIYTTPIMNSIKNDGNCAKREKIIILLMRNTVLHAANILFNYCQRKIFNAPVLGLTMQVQQQGGENIHEDELSYSSYDSSEVSILNDCAQKTIIFGSNAEYNSDEKSYSASNSYSLSNDFPQITSTLPCSSQKLSEFETLIRTATIFGQNSQYHDSDERVYSDDYSDDYGI